MIASGSIGPKTSEVGTNEAEVKKLLQYLFYGHEPLVYRDGSTWNPKQMCAEIALNASDATSVHATESVQIADDVMVSVDAALVDSLSSKMEWFRDRATFVAHDRATMYGAAHDDDFGVGDFQGKWLVWAGVVTLSSYTERNHNIFCCIVRELRQNSFLVVGWDSLSPAEYDGSGDPPAASSIYPAAQCGDSGCGGGPSVLADGVGVAAQRESTAGHLGIAPLWRGCWLKFLGAACAALRRVHGPRACVRSDYKFLEWQTRSALVYGVSESCGLYASWIAYKYLTAAAEFDGTRDLDVLLRDATDVEPPLILWPVLWGVARGTRGGMPDGPRYTFEDAMRDTCRIHIERLRAVVSRVHRAIPMADEDKAADGRRDAHKLDARDDLGYAYLECIVNRSIDMKMLRPDTMRMLTRAEDLAVRAALSRTWGEGASAAAAAAAAEFAADAAKVVADVDPHDSDALEDLLSCSDGIQRAIEDCILFRLIAYRNWNASRSSGGVASDTVGTAN
jgi:hypothetical protein